MHVPHACTASLTIFLQPENRNTINAHISQHGSHSQILIQCTPTKVFLMNNIGEMVPISTKFTVREATP